MSVVDLTTESQAIAALQRAQSTRMDVHRLRKKIKHGDRETLQGVYLEPPACVRNLHLYEPLSWAPSIGSSKLAKLGRAAVQDGINLLLPFERASERSRAWVLSNTRVNKHGQVSLSRSPIATPRTERSDPGLSEFIRIDNAPLARIVSGMVLRLETTWERAAYDGGFRRVDTGRGAGSELRFRLGLVRYRGRPPQESITVTTALRICDGLGIDYQEAGIPE